MNSLYEALLCPGIIPQLIALGHSWILSRIFNNLYEKTRLVEVYGCALLTTYIDEEKYYVMTLYHVNNEKFLLHSVLRDPRWLVLSSKTVALKHDLLDKYLEKLNIKIFIKKKKDLLKKAVSCSGRKEYRCLLSTNEMLVYGSSYLTLTLSCRESSLEIKVSSFFDTLVEVIREPLIELIRFLERKKKIDNSLRDLFMDEIDKYILTYLSNLIIRRRLILKDIDTASDLVNYVKTHFKWWKL